MLAVSCSLVKSKRGWPVRSSAKGSPVARSDATATVATSSNPARRMTAVRKVTAGGEGTDDDECHAIEIGHAGKSHWFGHKFQTKVNSEARKPGTQLDRPRSVSPGFLAFELKFAAQ